MVTPRPLHRLAAWLGLALVFLTGVVPARGMVLCIEGDGCVRIELKSDGQGCAGCDEHADEHADTSERSADEGLCPCVDLEVPGASETPRWRVPVIDLDFDAGLRGPVFFASHAASLPLRGLCAPERPRPPDVLRAIRTVVILR